IELQNHATYKTTTARQNQQEPAQITEQSNAPTTRTKHKNDYTNEAKIIMTPTMMLASTPTTKQC
ncbi:8259_t:CDS:2, partial [Ambispora leptoticha]